METPLEWSEDTTKLLEVIRNAPRVDLEIINNIFGLGSNGVRERAWKRILSGHLDVSTLKYASTSLKIFSYLPVNAQDINRAIREMLPVITWEAYFAAEMFGLSSNKKLDGREKKRNFEATKKSMDRCSKWLHYYIYRICGIASKFGADGKQVLGDSMLSLVASMYLRK